MRELFEKVYIKSESELPTEGEYLALKRGHYNPENIIFEDGNMAMINYWMTHLDWYLRPLKDESLREALIKFYEWETDYPDYASNKREVPKIVDKYLHTKSERKEK
jgi:hypothetical protein